MELCLLVLISFWWSFIQIFIIRQIKERFIWLNYFLIFLKLKYLNFFIKSISTSGFYISNYSDIFLLYKLKSCDKKEHLRGSLILIVA